MVRRLILKEIHDCEIQPVDELGGTVGRVSRYQANVYGFKLRVTFDERDKSCSCGSKGKVWYRSEEQKRCPDQCNVYDNINSRFFSD